MEKTRCCVCHDFFAPNDVKWLGGRAFCQRHHDLALDATEVRWSRAGLIEAAMLALFVALVAIAFGNTPLPTSLGLGLGLALVPAAIFLVFVYRQDRIEPEPISLVAGVFLLGLLLGYALVDPLGDWLLGRDGWQHRTEISAWVASVGVRGTLTVFFSYLAVRYTVYLTDEFDEPVDGIIYITAVMLGMATASNMNLVTHHDGILPVAGATAMASTTIIHVGSGVILGYGLGRARFDAATGQRWLAAAFATAAVLHGALHEIILLAGTATGTFEPLIGFGAAIGLTAIVLASSHYITVRFARQTLEGDSLAFE